MECFENFELTSAKLLFKQRLQDFSEVTSKIRLNLSNHLRFHDIRQKCTDVFKLKSPNLEAPKSLKISKTHACQLAMYIEKFGKFDFLDLFSSGPPA